ncbi:uba-2 [Pristionchus pacificus]|nr:uba-2 [Pristionchus pacificus]|eukprot:PDM81170.1 uba-2 [Pristionchus pacificus]
MSWREKQTAMLAEKKVLMVGAGGIGCELLKNIVLAGFRDIHVIDLDTIDVSNLNRQFLFRREHVGKSKVATAAGLRIAPDAEVKIVFDHDSIFSEKFNYEFFKQFAFVLNALDNRSARNHVNRMCMSTHVPLIDGGTAGYLGQVRTMVRGATECYECVPKDENKKSFPGCTIRNTPSEHIHCTVWSKHVFNQLFGEVDIDDDVSPDMDDEEAKEKLEVTDEGMESGDGPKEEGGDAKLEEEEEEGGKGEEQKEKPSNTRMMAEESGYNPEIIFNKLFVDDIHYLLKMANLWKERRPPVPQPFGELATENAGSSTISTAAQMDPAQRVWTPAENGDEFRKAVEELRVRKAAAPDGILSWDKDDDAAMRFVAACANIRAVIFGIPMKSLFEIKSMAGNIIPAIATTNAIIAGIMTVDALRIAAGHADKIASSILLPVPNFRGMVVIPEETNWVGQESRRIDGYQIVYVGLNNQRNGVAIFIAPKYTGIIVEVIRPEPVVKPNPSCYTCSAKREVTMRVNVEKMTVETLRDKVLMGALGVGAPDVMEATTSKVILSSEPGETDGLLGDTLSLHGLSMGGRLLVEDFDSSDELRLVVLQAAAFDDVTFEIVSDEKPEVKEEGEEEEEMAEKMEDATIGKKRKTMDETEFPVKKARVEEEEEISV